MRKRLITALLFGGSLLLTPVLAPAAAQAAPAPAAASDHVMHGGGGYGDHGGGYGDHHDGQDSRDSHYRCMYRCRERGYYWYGNHGYYDHGRHDSYYHGPEPYDRYGNGECWYHDRSGWHRCGYHWRYRADGTPEQQQK